MDAIVQTLAAAAPGDLAAQTRLARSQRLLGIVAFQDLADTEGARQYFTRALEINRACLAQLPNDDKKYDLANTLGQASRGSRAAWATLKASPRALPRRSGSSRVAVSGQGEPPAGTIGAFGLLREAR